LGILSCLFILLIGCDGSKKDWEKAKQSKSISEIKTFLTQYPDSKFYNEAKTLLASLEFYAGKWKPSVNHNENLDALIFSLVRIGYEIIGDTLRGYASKDFSGDPTALAFRVVGEDEDSKQKLSSSFVKVSEAIFSIKSSTDTLVIIELQSGNELKFGFHGYGYVSDVVPGTIISFKKSGGECIFERQLNVIKDNGTNSNEIIKNQYELIFFLGKEESGTYSLRLESNDFSIDEKMDFSKSDKNQ